MLSISGKAVSKWERGLSKPCEEHAEKLVDLLGLAAETQTKRPERVASTFFYYNHPKYVLLTDDFAGGNYRGIKTMHVANFLLSDEY